MAARRWMIACASLLLAGAQLFPEGTEARGAGSRQAQRPEAAAQASESPIDNSVPANLPPLLAAPQSELRLVTQRYTTDRNTLNGNYDGGRAPGRGGQGRGAAPEGGGERGTEPPAATVLPPSP